jgi:predicted transcriptional regulator
MLFALLVVIVIVFGIYFVYQYHEGKKKEAQIKTMDSVVKNKYKILTYLDNIKRKTEYKMKVMEALSIEIEPMKMCVKQLKEEKLITEDANSISLTDFGKNFAQVFVKGETK